MVEIFSLALNNSSEKADMEEIAHILEQNGFIKMSDENRRITLNKGYTKEGYADTEYLIHLRYTGDNDELYFRDHVIVCDGQYYSYHERGTPFGSWQTFLK